MRRTTGAKRYFSMKMIIAITLDCSKSIHIASPYRRQDIYRKTRAFPTHIPEKEWSGSSKERQVGIVSPDISPIFLIFTIKGTFLLWVDTVNENLDAKI